MSDWHGKPYYSLDAYCKNTFRHKCYKIALNVHMTCPNRDGQSGTQGCIFCSAGGSGDFAVSTEGKSVEEQLSEGLAKFHGKFQRSGSCADLIAYFQAYSNTYAPVSYLERVYRAALDCPWVCGVSIATRPDCLPPEVLTLLSALRNAYPDKFIWVELGLQTIHRRTAEWIRRGYELPCFEESFLRLKHLGIPVIVHLILGLPGETDEMILESVRYVNRQLPFGVKLQLLHILEGTDLAAAYRAGKTPEPFHIMERDEYLQLVIDCLRRLSPEIVIHRLTGDGARQDLIAPLWSLNKKEVLNALHHLMKESGALQGDLL